MKKFNNWLAIKITNIVSTVWCAYAFTILALMGLPSAIQQSLDSITPLPIISWTAQTFLQLVLLSIIMVGQNIHSQASEKRMEKILKHISKENDKILKEIKHLGRAL